MLVETSSGFYFSHSS